MNLVNKVQAYSHSDNRRIRGTAYLAKAALKTVVGDFVETGVMKGGTAAMLALILKDYDHCNRHLWGFDTFNSMDASAPMNASLAGGATGGSVETVQQTLQTLGAWDPAVVTLVPGAFNDTLPNAAVKNIALLRLDGETFLSSWHSLANLYDKMVPGGYIYVDDYGSQKGCREAVDLFRYMRRIYEPMHWVYESRDHCSVEAVWWRKAGGLDSTMDEYVHEILLGQYKRRRA